MAPLSKDDAQCVDSVALPHEFLDRCRSLLIRSLLFRHKCASFSVHTIKDTTQLLPEQIILDINKQGMHIFRAEPKTCIISAPWEEIIRFGCDKTLVYFNIRVSGVVQIFQFGTTDGSAVCWNLQKHIHNRIDKRLWECKKLELRLEGMKKAEDVCWQQLRAEELDITDVAKIQKTKEQMTDLMKIKVERRKLKKNVKDRLEYLITLRDNALSQMEDLATAGLLEQEEIEKNPHKASFHSSLDQVKRRRHE